MENNEVLKENHSVNCECCANHDLSEQNLEMGKAFEIPQETNKHFFAR